MLSTMTKAQILEAILFWGTPRECIGHEVLALSTGNSTALASVPNGASCALIQVEEVTTSGSSNVIRYWMDGSAPTATEGLIRGDHEAFDIMGYDAILKFRAIRLSANAHKLHVQYFR